MADARSFDRRRKIADALLAQSMTPGQGGQMVGRYYVGSGLTDGITKLGQALLARSAYNKADAEEGQFNLETQQKQQAALDELMQATQGEQELDFNSIGNVEQGGSLQYKRGTPSNRELGMALMRAQNAGLDVGGDAMKLIVGNTAPTEALGVTQTDEQGNVWNLNKLGQWNKAPFQARNKPDYEPMRLSLEQKRLEAQLLQMRQNAERQAREDARSVAKDDAGLNAPIAAVDRIIEIAGGKDGIYSGTVGDKAVYSSLGLGVGKTDAKFDNTRAIEQLETSLLLASKPPGMGAMSDGEWDMLKKGIPRRADFPNAQSYLSAVRNYRSNLEAKIRAYKGQSQPKQQPTGDIDANSFFGQ